jgi:hypothetical protein
MKAIAATIEIFYMRQRKQANLGLSLANRLRAPAPQAVIACTIIRVHD